MIVVFAEQTKREGTGLECIAIEEKHKILSNNSHILLLPNIVCLNCDNFFYSSLNREDSAIILKCKEAYLSV